MGYGLVVGSSRLFEAAEFLLSVVESQESGNCPAERSLHGPTIDAVPRTRHFTQTELITAIEFLVRMGFIRLETFSA